MNVAIETTNLTRDFGKFRAVNELSLRVEAGRFYGFLGPNGAGQIHHHQDAHRPARAQQRHRCACSAKT